MAVRNGRARTYQRYLEELHIPQDHFRLEDDYVRCLFCTTALKSLKLYTFERHLRMNKHQDAINLQNQPVFPAPQHLSNLNSRHSSFFKDLAAVCIKSDISFDKVCQPIFAKFLETHTQHNVPDPTTLSKTYVPIVYNETLQAIREEIEDNPIWLSADETVDSRRRCVVNIIVGALFEDRPSRGQLMKSGEIRTPNAENMAAYVTEALNEFLPNLNSNRLLLYLTDAVPYMKAGEIGENEDIDQEIRDKVEQVFEDNRGLAQMINVQECITTGLM
ncbi:hypothetical protein KQX54_011652 [Cotesia glomerata]|uniref:C2H2-type domain-containing protein n=1 Tax=Cotesia glomerata TaxID=32391 RepID=A0AAV7I8N3_COTGL|nr:hypothetical protein KQX54_011652 [Cotesia glomerata]